MAAQLPAERIGGLASLQPATVRLAADVRYGGFRVAPTGSKASPNVRYAFNGDRICASQRTDTMCQQQTFSRYSITSSARPSNIDDTSSPIAFAALRLITSSNLVGCSTANSAGFAP